MSTAHSASAMPAPQLDDTETTCGGQNHVSLQSLPVEVLRTIIQMAADDGGLPSWMSRRGHYLVNYARVSRLFRDVAQELLFRAPDVTLSQTYSLHNCLSTSERLRSYVKEFSISDEIPDPGEPMDVRDSGGWGKDAKWIMENCASLKAVELGYCPVYTSWLPAMARRLTSLRLISATFELSPSTPTFEALIHLDLEDVTSRAKEVIFDNPPIVFPKLQTLSYKNSLPRSMRPLPFTHSLLSTAPITSLTLKWLKPPQLKASSNDVPALNPSLHHLALQANTFSTYSALYFPLLSPGTSLPLLDTFEVLCDWGAGDKEKQVEAISSELLALLLDDTGQGVDVLGGVKELVLPVEFWSFKDTAGKNTSKLWESKKGLRMRTRCKKEGLVDRT